MRLLAGTKLGPYEILSAIGAGGMGEVYRGRTTDLNTPARLSPDLLPRTNVASLIGASSLRVSGEEAGEAIPINQ